MNISQILFCISSNSNKKYCIQQNKDSFAKQWFDLEVTDRLHVEAEISWAPFLQEAFQKHFVEWKFLYFDPKFADVCS